MLPRLYAQQNKIFSGRKVLRKKFRNILCKTQFASVTMKCCICARNGKHLHLLQIFKRFLVCRGTRDFGVHHTNFVTCAASVLCPHIILHIVKLLSSCSYERTPANLKIDRVKTLTPHTLNHFFIIPL